ncbi:hypothetical protein HGRIS_006088 [Hohenbuehelia grisea]|uniref:AB hydrolase-1 domain-containing protein n=1 Tax=Hohenbuehelia grisea TaxID=104357 RepID=A0ABR3JZA5_9AGAR
MFTSFSRTAILGLFLLFLHIPLTFAAPSTSSTKPTVKLLKSADGTTIYADAIGNPAKQSLVFLHGFALSGVVFDNLFTNKKLLDNFYLVRYDMRGHGRSGKPATPDAHVSVRYADDFSAVLKGFNLKKPIFIGWSLASAVITDIVANINPIPIAAAVALGGSPGIDGTIVPQIASQLLLTVLPEFNQKTDVTLALQARVDFVNALFANPQSDALKDTYLGQTVVQSPDVSALVSLRPQDPSKLFDAASKGFQLLILSGQSDKMVIGSAVSTLFAPHFTKNNLVTKIIPGGHALWEDNQTGMVTELTNFVTKVTGVRTI